MNIRDAAVLVTGASRGLGRALGAALAREGARVVLVARPSADLEATVASIRAEGGEAHGLAFDVADKESVYRIAGAAAALVGPIDLLVNNASTLGPLPMPSLLDTACEDFASVLETNLLAPFRLTKAIAGSMVVRGRGLVLFVSSDAAIAAYPNWGAYGVSKAAQDHLARSFAAELAPVRFLSVDPGEMDTAMHAQAMPSADRAALARPGEVARRFVELVRRADALENGARVADLAGLVG